MVSAAGAAAAATLASRRWLAAIDGGIAKTARLALFVLAVAILGLAFATPYLGWRLGGRRVSRAQPTVVA